MNIVCRRLWDRELTTRKWSELNGFNFRYVQVVIAGTRGTWKDFSNWIKKQIERARLMENRDYVTYAQKGVGGKFDSIEYYLTLESGKHIAMLSGTEKGFEVREYFIECEQVARQPVDPMKALNDPAAMRGLLLTYTEKVLALEEEKKVMAPKVDAFDRISNADGLTCITDTAKSLQMRPKDLFAWLSANQWIYRRAGGNPRDIGGKTYMGISRIYWPDWPGWSLIHHAQKTQIPLDLKRSGMLELVQSFYKTNFWTRLQGDKLAALSPEIAYEVFDTAVNMDVPDAVRFLQTALNMQRTYSRSYQELFVDGLLGPVTLIALDRYLATQPGDRESNEQILLNCVNGEQYIHYKDNPQHPYFRGWFLRV